MGNEKPKIRFKDYKAKLLYPLPEETAIRQTETCARICYRSEAGDIDNAISFLKKCWERQHLSVFEHVNLTCYIRMDRGLLQEIARHRHNSFSVESTRFVKYQAGKTEVILPGEVRDSAYEDVYKGHVAQEIEFYFKALESGMSPQAARGLLPNVLAVQLYTTANLRQWMHIFNLRWMNPGAHPDFRSLMSIVADEFLASYPSLFGEILGLKDMAEKWKKEQSLEKTFEG